MKKTILTTMFVTLMCQNLFGIVGFGVSFSQGMFSVPESTSQLIKDDLDVGSFTQHKFGNGLGIGGYFYIDAIPVVDLDFEYNLLLSSYEFSFNNVVTQLEKEPFVWISGSSYLTVQKELFKFSVPLLAKAKLTTGLGVNSSSSIPMINQKMLEAVVGGNDIENGSLDENDLIDYLKENKESTSGFHVQAGVQFKLLAFDSFLYYRQVFAENVVINNNTYGSLNLRLGMGI